MHWEMLTVVKLINISIPLHSFLLAGVGGGAQLRSTLLANSRQYCYTGTHLALLLFLCHQSKQSRTKRSRGLSLQRVLQRLTLLYLWQLLCEDTRNPHSFYKSY